MSVYSGHPKLKLCADLMGAGGCIAYPTEAVWGLGCDPYDYDAVQRILMIKHRPEEKGLILISGYESHFYYLLRRLEPTVVSKIHASWPGHTTWLVPHYGLVPRSISGGRDTVALRVSAHPVVRALSKQFGAAFVSTSANLTGKLPARSALKARLYFSETNMLITPGCVGKQQSSSRIIDALTGEVIRA